MPLIQNEEMFKELLEDQYFEMLEENGVDYLVYDRVSDDPPHTQTHIKDQYILSDDEMAQELGFDDYKAWKKEAINGNN